MGELDKEKSEVEKLVGDIMEEKDERVSLVQRLAQAEGEYEKLKSQLETMVQAKKTLESKVKEIISQKGVELDKIIIQPDSPLPKLTSYEPAPEYSGYEPDFRAEEPGADGEVLIVNKKFDFVIVDMGKSSGVGLGDYLEIYKNGEFVAEAQIEKLYERMSAATISPQYKSANIKPGDEVIIAR